MAANMKFRGRGFARGRSLQFTKMSVGGASQACHLSTAPQRTMPCSGAGNWSLERSHPKTQRFKQVEGCSCTLDTITTFSWRG